MSRTVERSGLPDDVWRRLVERDLDDHDATFDDVRVDLAEIKETTKWVLRTMIGLLISVVIVAAGLIGGVIR